MTQPGNHPTEPFQAIGAGSILVEQNTFLPGPLGLESGTTESGWARITGNPNRQQLEAKLATAGWAFFYMAGKIKTSAFGFERASMIQAALKRLIAIVKLQNCNCLEIDAIRTRSFLGLPYISLSAHSRHIQDGMLFGSHAGSAE
jgi:hypothetical protein